MVRATARALVRRTLTEDQRDSLYLLRQNPRRELSRVRGQSGARIRARIQKNNLDVLALAHGTDKSSFHHDYARLYQRHLAPIRSSASSVLEIGVGGKDSWHGYETPLGGHSLRMWADYFPRANVVGVDIFAKDVVGPRIAFEQGDQSDPAFLERVIADHGPFDLVVDDGSHVGRHIIASFRVLWKAVKPGGFYVIEDLETAYLEDWEGGAPGTSGTAVSLLKELVDRTLYAEGTDRADRVAALHVYSARTAILQKLERPT